MKTLKSFKLFAVLFMAMFLGTSFTESASAQVDNDVLKAYLDEICSQNEEALKGSGIISMNVNTEGSILSYEVLIDENMVSLDIFSMICSATSAGGTVPEMTPESTFRAVSTVMRVPLTKL